MTKEETWKKFTKEHPFIYPGMSVTPTFVRAVMDYGYDACLNRTCKWTFDKMHDAYYTECGTSFSNKYGARCPCCGGKIEEE